MSMQEGRITPGPIRPPWMPQCAECIRTLEEARNRGSRVGPPSDAVTLIEGTAYCRRHAVARGEKQGSTY